ncbi:MAG: DUF427 domain-containing protein [Actinobacteria bacterium]|nr:DUF427 domain-containing protein [Actinomycetota bacterium]
MGNRFVKTEERVRVDIDGVTVADSTDVIALHEGSLPIRYYFPKSDVRFDLLTPTQNTTRCHWKGDARYWSADVRGRLHADVLWGYDEPLPGAADIAGRVAFYNERVDIRTG